MLCQREVAKHTLEDGMLTRALWLRRPPYNQAAPTDDWKLRRNAGYDCSEIEPRPAASAAHEAGRRYQATIKSFSTDVAPGAAQAVDEAVRFSSQEPTVPVSLTRPSCAVTWTFSGSKNHER
jgi:hypothetical protein